MRTWIPALVLALYPAASAEDEAEALERPEIAAVGELAPDFALKDLEGDEVALEDLEGRIVVLEWFNPDCEYVQRAHGEGGPLRDLPARSRSVGLVWLAVNSSAPGRRGHGAARNREAAEAMGVDYPVLLDERGEVGRRFQARTTPQLFVIDAEGVLVYSGAPDSAPMGRPAGEREDYLASALESLGAGAPVPTPETRPWGCSVKYGQ